MIGDDASNPSGGLEALFANPEKFNICWVDDMPTMAERTLGGMTDSAASREDEGDVAPSRVGMSSTQVLRHLEPEEEERYLELEKNMAGISDPFMIGDDAREECFQTSAGIARVISNHERVGDTGHILLQL
jgi:hypothetical protein